MRLHAYPKLSDRSLQVYDWIVEESDLGFIARKLKISKSAVKQHVGIILERTKCSSRTELVIKHYKQKELMRSVAA